VIAHEGVVAVLIDEERGFRRPLDLGQVVDVDALLREFGGAEGAA
jgi:hypothetical protein